MKNLISRFKEEYEEIGWKIYNKIDVAKNSFYKTKIGKSTDYIKSKIGDLFDKYKYQEDGEIPKEILKKL